MSASLDTDPGWTTSGQWAFGHPTGGGAASYGSRDPANGHLGANVYGVNLSGDYSTAAGGPYYLTTLAIDCTGFKNINVSFRRWLNTDYLPYAAATVEVSNDGTTWNTVYSNPSSTAVTDSSWQFMQYSIGAHADNQPTVYLRWGYQTFAEAYAYSGWNIDEIAVTGIPTGPTPGLTLSVAAPSVSEGGTQALTGTVTREGDFTSPLLVKLVSSDTSEATVPFSISIPAGQPSATFDITPVDDTLFDGNQTVTISATASFGSGPLTADASFGTSGAVITTMDNSVRPQFLDIETQPDGKILAIGQQYGTGDTWHLLRLNPDGTYDPSFGTSGIVSTAFPGESWVAPSGIVQHSDGKITIIGKSLKASLAARYNPDGSLDTSFDGDGKAIIAPGFSNRVYDGIANPDGSMYVAGEGGHDLFLAKIKADGSLDTTFGNAGIVAPAIPPGNEVAYAIQRQPDGKLILVGSATYTGGNDKFLVARFNADGTFDTTFSATGYRLLDLGYRYEQATSFALQTDGRIVLAGYVETGSPSYACSWGVVRVDAAGNLDASFSDDGIDTIPGHDDHNYANDVVVQPDGKILVVGGANVPGNGYDRAVVRYNSDGTRDASFGINGILILPPLPDVFEREWAATVQPDGKLVTFCGDSADYRVERFIIPGLATASNTLEVIDNEVAPTYDYGDAPATYSTVQPVAEGRLDASFNGDGKEVADFGGTTEEIKRMVVESDGEILAVGTGGSPSRFALARYHSDGTLDSSFGNGGKLLIDNSTGSPAVVSLPDGDILLGTTPLQGSPGFRILRLNHDGSLDSDFGAAGEAFLAAGGVQPNVSDLLLQPDGKIVVVGYDLFGANWDGVLARLNSNGSADAAFGAGGVLRVDFDRTEITDPIDQFLCGLILPDGKILAGGFTSTTPVMTTNNRIYALARYMADGSPDPTFGVGGKCVFSFTTGILRQETVTDLIRASEGKLVIASGGGSTTVLARLNVDGSVDASFGSAGRLVVAAGSPFADPRQLALDNSGKIVAVGQGMAVSRFLSTGSIDSSFGSGGCISVSFGQSSAGASALALQPDGNIVAGGYSGLSNANYHWALMRITAMTSTLAPAEHLIAGGVYLGNGVDNERNGRPSAAADGDDAYGSDDEDGVSFTSPLVPGGMATLSVTASTSGGLYAWIDCNCDGDFADDGEQVLSQNVTSGVNTISFMVPSSAVVTDQTYARFRFSRCKGVTYYGLFGDGEVEDYKVAITTPTSAIGDRVWIDSNANGIQDLNEPGMANIGVELYRSTDSTVGNADDMLVAHTVTDAEGHFAFTALGGAPNYYLSFHVPSGFSFTTKDAAGSADDSDSDANALGFTDLFTLLNDQTVNNFGAGLIGTAPEFGFGFRIGGASWDEGWSLSVDAAGNAYVIGSFQGTVDMDPGPGEHKLTSVGERDIFIAKYSLIGSLLWGWRIGGSSYDVGTSIKVTDDGTVFATGSFNGTVDFDPGSGAVNLASSAIFVMKMDTNGNLVWARGLGGDGAFGASQSIALAKDGSVYTTGYFSGGYNGGFDFDPGASSYILYSSQGNDIFVSKLDSEGNFLWARKIGGTGDDVARDIAVANDGSVYFTGYFSGTADFDPGTGVLNLTSAGMEDIFIAKLDFSGNFGWAERIGSTYSDQGYGIALGFDGSVYSTGNFRGTVDFDPGSNEFPITGTGNPAYILKLNFAGNFAWVRPFEGTNSQNSGSDIKVTADGSIYTTGWFGRADFDPGPDTFALASAGGGDMFVSRLNSAGDFVSAFRIGGASDDHSNSIDVSDNGSVYITGRMQGTIDCNPGPGTYNLTGSGFDAFIGKISPDHAPADVALPADSVAENQPIGTLVGVFSTLDSDSGDAFSYSLIAGDGSSDNGSFTISANGQLMTAAVFDFESKSAYSIRVRTTDYYGMRLEKAFTITITSVAPVTRTWDGGGSDNRWTTAANWIGDVAPSPGDELVFPAGAAQLDSVNDFPADTQFGDITVSGTGYRFLNRILSNAAIRIPTGELTVASIVADSLIIGTSPARRTWDGGGADNRWTTAANWVGDVAPSPGDDLVFSSGANQPQSINSYPSGTAFGSLTIVGNFSFAGGVTSTGSVRVDSGTLTTSSIVSDSLVIGSATGTMPKEKQIATKEISSDKHPTAVFPAVKALMLEIESSATTVFSRNVHDSPLVFPVSSVRSLEDGLTDRVFPKRAESGREAFEAAIHEQTVFCGSLSRQACFEFGGQRADWTSLPSAVERYLAKQDAEDVDFAFLRKKRSQQESSSLAKVVDLLLSDECRLS